MKTAFFPLARTTFFMESAEENLKKSREMLQGIFPGILIPDHLLTDPAELGDYADTLGGLDLVIYQCSTFVGAEFVYELTRRFECPVVIWSVREPSIEGTRLKLNSLTGAFSAANSVYAQGRAFEFIFGNPDEAVVAKSFKQLQQAMQLIIDMKNMVVGIVGSQPPGFGFGAVNESEIAGAFGIRLRHIEAAAIMEKAKNYTEEQCQIAVAELKERTDGMEDVPAENLLKYTRLRTAFSDFVKESGVKALASRCWPDFFVGFGAPVCAVLSMLNENGIASSCEADVGGAITMFMGSELTGSATYFGDPVAVDEENDAIVFWHCGAGAACLASQRTGAKLGVHPNRKIGPTMEFGLKPGDVTVLRLGYDQNGYRMFLLKGEALDEPQKFYGTSVTVRPKSGMAAAKIKNFINDGWEPHFVIAYGDVVEEVKLMCKFLKIRVFEYH